MGARALNAGISGYLLARHGVLEQIGADLLTESAMQLSGDWWAHTACYATAFIRWPCARSHIESGFAEQSMSDMGFIVN